MSHIKVLIPAAGLGTRANLPYPKTLYKYKGIPILHRLLQTLSTYDNSPSVVLSPSGLPTVHHSLAASGISYTPLCQPTPSGMGDAVLSFMDDPAYSSAETIILAWGDLAGLTPSTVETLYDHFRASGSDLAFTTANVISPYTYVVRDSLGRVSSLLETRHSNVSPPPVGERDIGLFIFRKEPVFSILQEAKSHHNDTSEYGFLHIVAKLSDLGYVVTTLQNATKEDCISLNSVDDLVSPSSHSL